MNTLGETSVGSVVYLRVDGDYKPFRVMHHGKPSGLYDDSFIGGTILCKDYTGTPYSTQMVSPFASNLAFNLSSYSGAVIPLVGI